MEGNIDVIDLVSTLLDAGKINDALNVPNEEKYKDAFKDNCWDLITVVTEKIEDDTITIKPSLYGACEKLLSITIETCTPEEALLELIERVELAKNDAQFGITLPALLQVMKKLSTKRGKSLEWCLNSITTYIENIPIPELQLEGDERKLMDCDPNYRRITKVYSALPSFYQFFIEELSEKEEPNIKTKQILSAFLVNLLGKPIIYIDIDPKTNERSEVRQICFTIIQDLYKLEKNLLKFLCYVEVCSKEPPKSKSSDKNYEIEPYDDRDRINITTLSGFFYVVYSGHFDLPTAAIPQVYSNEYIIHTILHTVNHLLGFNEYGPLSKALALCEALNSRLVSNTSHRLLSSSPVHYSLLKMLIQVIVFSTYVSIRKHALVVLGIHLNKFDYKGKCLLIKFLMEHSNHSGLIGFAIGEYKNCINQSLNEPELNDCFKGDQLLEMIRIICHLPHGAESDLMELADQIITSLNFLRYIVIKGRHNNKIGIKDLYSIIEKDYLEVLRTALKMSRAHYELKLHELKEGKPLCEDTDNITLSVAGNVLNSMPPENKLKIIESALNVFHLMEILMATLVECMKV